mmetsp:Transcript_121546/g.223900  ORF Transcript_121546/g.223900 Transcript_121546/m.223900 type:complete len:276 (-) Transcript_121546:51-878(-)
MVAKHARSSLHKAAAAPGQLRLGVVGLDRQLGLLPLNDSETKRMQVLEAPVDVCMPATPCRRLLRENTLGDTPSKLPNPCGRGDVPGNSDHGSNSKDGVFCAASDDDKVVPAPGSTDVDVEQRRMQAVVATRAKERTSERSAAAEDAGTPCRPRRRLRPEDTVDDIPSKIPRACTSQDARDNSSRNCKGDGWASAISILDLCAPSAARPRSRSPSRTPPWARTHKRSRSRSPLWARAGSSTTAHAVAAVPSLAPAIPSYLRHDDGDDEIPMSQPR